MRYHLFYFSLLVIFATITLALKRYRYIDRPLKIFLGLLVSSFLSELAGIYSEYLYNNKAPVYHIFSILELFLICTYYIYCIKNNSQLPLVLSAFLMSILLGLGNLVFFQKFTEYNTNMLMIECVIIIGMSLFSLFKIVQKEDVISIVTYPHFHITIAMLLLWTSTFFFWAFLNYFKTSNAFNYEVIGTGQVIVNLIIYCYIGFVFLRHKPVS